MGVLELGSETTEGQMQQEGDGRMTHRGVIMRRMKWHYRLGILIAEGCEQLAAINATGMSPCMTMWHGHVSCVELTVRLPKLYTRIRESDIKFKMKKTNSLL